jgi:uncharacterized protein YbjT (DUF2867 family)
MGRIAVAGATGRVGKPVVDVLGAAGHEVVPISRSHGVDVVTGEGLAKALVGVDAIIDAATSPSPDEREATEFFLAASHNLEREGERSGVKRLVVVSIIGTDKVSGGYNAAKVAQEKAAAAGPIPLRILRAAQFHEFVGELMGWGTQDGVVRLPDMRTQLVAARTVAEALVDLATDGWDAAPPISEIAGPRAERLPEVAAQLAARRGDALRIEVVSGFGGLDTEAYEAGALLPGPDATLAGPTFEQWLDETYGAGMAA